MKKVYCEFCRKRTNQIKEKYESDFWGKQTILHVLLMFVTFGIWIPVFICLYAQDGMKKIWFEKKGTSWICGDCGRRNRQ